MNIKVIGWASGKIEQVLLNTYAAASERHCDRNIEWINDVEPMSELGIIHTPALIVNGKLKVTGRVPSVYEISAWIEEELNEIAA